MPNYTPFKEEPHATQTRISKFISKVKVFVGTLQANLKNEASGTSVATIAAKAEQMAARTGEQLKQAQALSVLIDKLRKQDPQDIQEKIPHSKLRYAENYAVQSEPSTRKQERVSAHRTKKHTK